MEIMSRKELAELLINYRNSEKKISNQFNIKIMSRKELAELLINYRNSENIQMLKYTELGGGDKCISLRAEGSFGFPKGSQCNHAIGLEMQKISVAFVLRTEKK